MFFLLDRQLLRYQAHQNSIQIFIQCFEDEVKILTDLSHPHIIRVFEFNTDNSSPYLVMEFAPNGSVNNIHRQGTTLPLVTVLIYAKQLASALQYIHDKGIIHRDIKPHNILISKNNKLLLGGWGIACSYRLDDYKPMVVGTPIYMSPELLNDKRLPASDQYSLAVVIYEWLCGNVPFQSKANEFVEIALQILHKTPPSLREKNPAIPHEVEEVVMKALAKDPEKRYESIQDFAEALEEAIAPQQASKFTISDRSGEQFGQYRLERLLGIGGFAEVYLGKHIKLDTLAAIKVLHTRLSVKELESFDKEAKVIASLRHPSIVRVLDYDAQGNVPFLVLDHAPKGTMRQFHAR